MIRLGVFFNDKNKKSYSRIFNEITDLFISKKEFPLYYFAKFLYRKDVIDYKAYLSQKETRKIVSAIKPKDSFNINLVRNKLNFGLFLDKNHIRTPKIFGFNEGNEFQINENRSTINSEINFHVFLKKLSIAAKDSKLFVKPFSEQGGKDCYLLDIEALETSEAVYLKKISAGNFLYQEYIKQHPSINTINPYAINSIRFNSFIDDGGETHILSAFMRFGRNGSVVDNGSSGGFYVPVNLLDGKLKYEGKQLMRFGGKVFHKHPDTNFNFSNFKIPFFDEACSLIYKTAPLIPFKMLGWDIAITENEPILIEVNDNFSLFVADIAYGGYLKHPLIEKFIKDINE